jgi:hypothetical protein
MTQTLVDRETQQKLGGLADVTLLRGEDGAVLGTFHPAKARRIYAEGEMPELTEEEIRRRLSEPGGKSWEEIRQELDHLS